MQRATTIVTVELTFARLTEKAVLQAATKSLLVSLRKKAVKEGWIYDIWISLSISEAHTARIQMARPHIHLIIMGNPGSTISKYITKYWRKRHGKITASAKLTEPSDVNGKYQYIIEQAEFMWKQHHQLAKLDGGLQAILENYAGNQMNTEIPGRITFSLPQYCLLVNNKGKNSTGNRSEEDDRSGMGRWSKASPQSKLVKQQCPCGRRRARELPQRAIPISSGNALKHMPTFDGLRERALTLACPP